MGAKRMSESEKRRGFSDLGVDSIRISGNILKIRYTY
jgi:hypothetical protein